MSQFKGGTKTIHMTEWQRHRHLCRVLRAIPKLFLSLNEVHMYWKWPEGCTVQTLEANLYSWKPNFAVCVLQVIMLLAGNLKDALETVVMPMIDE